MRIIPLFALATVVTECEISDVIGETKGFFSSYQETQRNGNSKLPGLETVNKFGVSQPRNNFSGMAETMMEEHERSMQYQNEIKHILKQTIAAKPRDYKPEVNKSIFKVNLDRGVGQIRFQSDIILAERPEKQYFMEVENSARTKRQVLKSFSIPNSTWKNGVYYTFNTTDRNVQKAFEMGAKVWSEATCIEFIEDKDAKDKVVVTNKGSSHSQVGQVGGNQILSLTEGATTERYVVHEIGHVLGLYHTMSRYDRDNHITIFWQNIQPQHFSDFQKFSEDYAVVHGLSYDHGSIMHYSELSGSRDKRPTMMATDPLHQNTMGSPLISYSDIFMINEHHGCNAKCNKSTSAKCANKGFPHPRNCSICICPGGYGGNLCDQRPPGCGQDLFATNVKQTVECSVGHGSDIREQFDFCYYMVTAPEGRKVEVHILSISPGYDFAGCSKGGIEVKAQKDQRLTGYRFCSVGSRGRTVISSTNHFPVILFNKFKTMKTTFTYRYTD